MFGVIVSGRLVQTNFNQVGETQFVLNLEHAESIKHIVIFLTGAQSFPEFLGGAVYFSWPDEAGVPAWNYLGFISNEKPSVIFKISSLKNSESIHSKSLFQNHGMADKSAIIGISVEPLAQINSLTPSSSEMSNLNSFTQFSSRMCENLYNFMTSFAQSPDKIVPNPNEQYVPVSLLNKWFENFSQKLMRNPDFWKK